MHDFRMLEVICEIVAKSAQLKSSKPLYSNSRAPAFVKLRDTALFLIRSKTQLSFAEIGRPFGREHSSIHTAVRREEMRLQRNPPRADKTTWVEYHARLVREIDRAIADAVELALPN
jgi:chromosomal replication initiation ATPase DnaA